MHRLLLLAETKGNKVYFWKLVTFLGGGRVNFTPNYPLDPLEGVSRGSPSRKFSKGGGVSGQILSLMGGGSDPQGPPLGHLWL